MTIIVNFVIQLFCIWLVYGTIASNYLTYSAKQIILLTIAFVQMLISLFVHGYNTDGTSQKVAYLSSKDLEVGTQKEN